jgi:hypothetical protein
MTPTVEQVLAVLSHELRTPIGVAQSYLRLMREGSANDPARVPLVERTRDALTRVSEVTRQSDELARQLNAVATATAQSFPAELVSNAIADICAAVSIPYTKPTSEGESLQCRVRTTRPDVVATAFSALLDGLRRERAGRSRAPLRRRPESRPDHGGICRPAIAGSRRPRGARAEFRRKRAAALRLRGTALDARGRPFGSRRGFLSGGVTWSPRWWRSSTMIRCSPIT